MVTCNNKKNCLKYAEEKLTFREFCTAKKVENFQYFFCSTDKRSFDDDPYSCIYLHQEKNAFSMIAREKIQHK